MATILDLFRAFVRTMHVHILDYAVVADLAHSSAIVPIPVFAIGALTVSAAVCMVARDGGEAKKEHKEHDNVK